MFTYDQMYIIRWCVNECILQRSGELSVLHMLQAWNYASTLEHELISMRHVLVLGSNVEPGINEHGTRCVPVTFDNSNVLAWEHVEHALKNLIDAQDRLTAIEFYQEFERIHPFTDGNGRVGALLYNWHQKTLHRPVSPPLYESDN